MLEIELFESESITKFKTKQYCTCSGLQAVTWKNIGINIGHFWEKYRANIGKSSKI